VRGSPNATVSRFNPGTDSRDSGVRDHGRTKSALQVQPLHLDSTGSPAYPVMAHLYGPTVGVLLWTVPCMHG